MSQQSSLTQSAHSVRQVLTAYSTPKILNPKKIGIVFTSPCAQSLPDRVQLSLQFTAGMMLSFPKIPSGLGVAQSGRIIA